MAGRACESEGEARRYRAVLSRVERQGGTARCVHLSVEVEGVQVVQLLVSVLAVAAVRHGTVTASIWPLI